MSLSSPSVLVVEDDDDLGRFVVDIAKDHGYQATHVADAMSGLGLLPSGDFDLLITDIRMPGMDGIELIARAKKQDPSLAIIAITAFGSVETGMRALRVGASDYLSKPFRSDELSSRMRRALERRARDIEHARLQRQVAEVLRRGKS
ncbi:MULTISPECIES: response regulator [Sorangium]|uniref:Response regulator n=1 Tax=Sorangium atrum TaxID=2995308 RepID=A0ABT5CEB2_9BACT|nr:response regulator [Sorangium aterium]MDC0684119.1 response regulator [Sorangium aterium]